MSRRVILCSHNGARFIEEQISSIRAQTVPVDTIHVFDFASTDATRSILHRLATDAVLPRVFVKEHADAPGAALSFFRAFSEMAEVVSDTDCIFLADQDDVWLGTKVAQVTRRFDDAVAADPTGLVAVFHDVHVVDHALSPLRKSFYHADSPFALPRDLAPDRLLLANPAIGHTLAISGALLRAVNKSLTKPAYLMHDWAVVLVASRVGSVAFIPEALSLYRQHDANVLGAFKRRRPSEIYLRTLRFARGLLRQNRQFGRDTAQIHAAASARGGRSRASLLDRWLQATAIHAPFLAGPLLGILAFARGPTWQRRLLGGALWLAAVTEPFFRRSHR